MTVLLRLSFVHSCSYDYLEITEVGVDNSSGAQEWQLHDHHEAFSSDTEVGRLCPIDILSTYIHKHAPFSHGGRQKPQNATCYDPYILLRPRLHSYI